ncbi:DUF4817 domain-containing protein [Trichonephila clavipes]|nr:DUF4817 domain-containing protein [Trichonephila clavipes]
MSSGTEFQRLRRHQKYPGDAAPNASSTTRLVQRFRDTGSVADRKQSGRVPIVKRKATDGETTVQRSLLKRPSVYINIITEFISLLNSNERCLGCSKTAKRVTHHGTLRSIFCLQSIHTAENPDEKGRDVENGNTIRSAFVFSTDNSSSTSTPNSKSDLLQNCLLILLDVKSMKISSSEVESPSGVS